ncbi:hypothetical protein [Nocardia sp. NPDC004260]
MAHVPLRLEWAGGFFDQSPTSVVVMWVWPKALLQIVPSGPPVASHGLNSRVNVMMLPTAAHR